MTQRVIRAEARLLFHDGSSVVVAVRPEQGARAVRATMDVVNEVIDVPTDDTWARFETTGISALDLHAEGQSTQTAFAPDKALAALPELIRIARRRNPAKNAELDALVREIGW